MLEILDEVKLGTGIVLNITSPSRVKRDEKAYLEPAFKTISLVVVVHCSVNQSDYHLCGSSHVLHLDWG